MKTVAKLYNKIFELVLDKTAKIESLEKKNMKESEFIKVPKLNHIIERERERERDHFP